MKSPISRAIVLGLIAMVLSSVAMFGVSGFVLYRSGQASLDQMQRLVRTRGGELAVAMGTMAGEDFSGKNLVKLASVMRRTVAASRGKGDAFEVLEIALVDRHGRVRAHNDASKMAAGAKPLFSGAAYEAVLNRPQRDPLSFKETKAVAPTDLQLPEELAFLSDTVQSLLPELSAGKEYLISVAVYRVDEAEAAARLHMRIRVGVGEDYRAVLLRMIPVIAIATGVGILALGALLTLVFLLPAFRGSAARSASKSAPGTDKAKSKDQSQTAPPEERKAPPDSGPEATVADATGPVQGEVQATPVPQSDSEILDAIPLD